MNDKPTVMFVDDEERILRSMSILFRNQYNVITCTNGNAALSILSEKTVHVLVSDQRMPEMMGVELLRRARELSPSTMRLLLTGYSDLTAIIGSINDGEVFRYIQKPWQADELAATIAEAIEISLSTSVEEIDAQAEAVVPRPGGAQILVIDSDQNVLQQVTQAVNGEHPVCHVADLQGALEVVATENVAVLVSEANLAGQDLTTALKTIKRFNPNIVTIVMTSFSDTGVLVDLINQGSDLPLFAKTHPQGLLEISLNAALRRHNVLKQSPALVARHRVDRVRKESDAGMGERIMQMLKGIRERREPLPHSRN